MEVSFDQTIGLKSSRMNRKMIRFLNRSLEWYELTLEQWVVLSTLAEQESINQKTLSIKAGKDPASLLRILDILERKGFIERRQFQGDRRASSLFITDEGKKLRNEVAPYIEAHFKKITNNISERDIEIYEQVLKKIDHNLDELMDEQRI